MHALLLSGIMGWMGLVPGQLVFEPPELALGELRVGQNPVVRLLLRNSGTETATVGKLETSCGCLAGGKLPEKLEPDQAAVMDLRLRTLSLPTGPNAWRVKLSFTTETGNRVADAQCRLTATVRKEIEVEPTLLSISLGESGEAEHTVRVRDQRTTPLRVMGYTSTLKGVEARQDTGSPGVQAVRVKVRGSEVGKREGMLRLGTNDPDYPVLEVPLVVTVRPRQTARCTPDHVELRALTGEAVSRLIRVDRPDGKSAEVVRVSGGETVGIRVTHSAGPGSQTTMRLEASPARGEKAVELEVFMGDGVVVKLPVSVLGE